MDSLQPLRTPAFATSTPDAAAAAHHDDAHAEARRTLVDLAHRRFGAVPPALVVDRLLATNAGAGFSVWRAGLEALRRRWGFAQADGLVVLGRPVGTAVLGDFTTGRRTNRTGGRKPRAARPYTTTLESLEPLVTSCDCPDFLRSSLGLCKHGLTVLDAVFRTQRGAKRAEALRSSQARPDTRARTPAAGHTPRLHWDPRLPLTGELDRLAGLRLVGADASGEGPAGDGLVDGDGLGEAHGLGGDGPNAPLEAEPPPAPTHAPPPPGGEAYAAGDAPPSMAVAPAAPAVGDAPPSTLGATAPGAVAALLAGLRVERTARGTVRIEAEPEAAGALVSLFDAMARLVRGAAAGEVAGTEG